VRIHAAINSSFCASVDQLEIVILMASPAPLTFCVVAVNRSEAGGA
jgi:hypothetical protein